MRRPLDGPRRITGDTASHAAYGVGPATDYGADEGEGIFAPFSGTIDHWWSTTGGWTVRVTNGALVWIGQHLSGYRGPTSGWVDEGTLIGVVGSTGSASSGPHLHNWIEVNGVRMAFEEYLSSLGWGPVAHDGDRVSGPNNTTTTGGLEHMLSIVRDVDTGTVWLYSLLTGKRTGIRTVDDVQLIQRVINSKDNVDSLYNQQIDIVSGYINQVAPASPTPAPSVLTFTAAQLKTLAAQVASAVIAKLPKKLTAALVTKTGKITGTLS